MVACVALALLGGGEAARAEGPGVLAHHELTLMVVDPTPEQVTGELTAKQKQDLTDARALRKQKLAELAASRINARLQAAGVKHGTARAQLQGRLKVTAHTARSARWVEQVVMAPGRAALRPVLDHGELWAQLAGDLPKGVQLKYAGRGIKNATLWSQDADALKKFVDRLAIPQTTFTLYKQGSGWTALALGEPIVTDHQIGAAALRAASSGAPYAQITLTAEGVKRLTRAPAEQVALALELDGEVIEVLRVPPERRGASLTVTCPAWLGSASAIRECTELVAGRLASSMPIPLVRVR